jgi:predicted Zn-dependent peptidase
MPTSRTNTSSRTTSRSPQTDTALAPPTLVSAASSTLRRKTTLPNGVRVVSEEVPQAQSFALGVWIDAGSCDETTREHGMAHLLEHVVFRGTASRSATTIANYLESVGGYVNAFTTKDHTCYYTRALSQHFARSLDLIADIVARPTLREADCDKERGIIAEEIKSLEEEPEELINDVLDLALFKGHPFAHPISGSVRTLAGIEQAHVVDFHRRQYAAENVIVAVAGNISHEHACREAERFLGSLPPAPAKRRKRRVPTIRAAEHHTTHKPTQQAHYALAVMLPEPSDADYYALAALNIVLGDGMSSRLNQTIREKRGLCYNIYSSVTDMRDCAIFSIYGAMEPRNLATTQKLIQRELAQILSKPLTSAEIRRAKEQLKSSLIIGLESLSGRMNVLAKSELYVGRYDEISTRLAQIDAITAAGIMALAQRWMQPEAWHSVVMLPEDTSDTED